MMFEFALEVCGRANSNTVVIVATIAWAHSQKSEIWQNLMYWVEAEDSQDAIISHKGGLFLLGIKIIVTTAQTRDVKHKKHYHSSSLPMVIPPFFGMSIFFTVPLSPSRTTRHAKSVVASRELIRACMRIISRLEQPCARSRAACSKLSGEYKSGPLYCISHGKYLDHWPDDMKNGLWWVLIGLEITRVSSLGNCDSADVRFSCDRIQSIRATPEFSGGNVKKWTNNSISARPTQMQLLQMRCSLCHTRQVIAVKPSFSFPLTSFGNEPFLVLVPAVAFENDNLRMGGCHEMNSEALQQREDAVWNHSA